MEYLSTQQTAASKYFADRMNAGRPNVNNYYLLREVNTKIFFIFSVLTNALQEISGMRYPDRMSGDNLQYIVFVRENLKP